MFNLIIDTAAELQAFLQLYISSVVQLFPLWFEFHGNSAENVPLSTYMKFHLVWTFGRYCLKGHFIKMADA